MTLITSSSTAFKPFAARRPLSRETYRIAPWELPLLADFAVIAMAALVLPPVSSIAFAAVLVGMLAASGCYRPRFTGQLGGVISRLVTSVAVAAVAVGAFSAPRDAVLVLRLTPFIMAAVIGARALSSIGVRMVRLRTAGEPTLIIGAGALGARMAANLLEHPELGLNPIGIVDDVIDEELSLPLLGGTHELSAVAHRWEIRHVIVAFGRADEQRMVEVLRDCQRLDADVWVVPRLFELGASAGETDELWGIPVSKLNRAALQTSQWRVKRAFDVVVSAALLVIAAPAFAALALAVRLSSSGPVLFRQRRMGQREQQFDMLKFRTLRSADTSALVPGQVPVGSTEIQAARSRDVADRQTSVGKFLRRTSLDELPQLWNVLRGDLSLVGPRPEEIDFALQFAGIVPGYQARHRVPAGLTGLAQVNGLRGDTSIEDRSRFDNRYIDDWSLWTDVVILVRTIGAVLRGQRGAPSATNDWIDLRGETARRTEIH